MVRTLWSFFLLASVCAAQPTSILPDNLQQAFQISGLPASSKKIVNVYGMPFSWAWRLYTPPNSDRNPWDFRIRANGAAAVSQGDLILATFWMRTLESSAGAGLAQFVCERNSDPWTKSATWIAAAELSWKKVEIPFRMLETYAAGQYGIHLWITYPEQTIEIGGLSVIDYGPDADWRDLGLENYPYEGHRPDADWRALAAGRIERYRKGDIVVIARDQDGNLLSGVPVRVRMKRHSFRFGTAVAASLINDPAQQEYRDKIVELFNSVVVENALKWRQWDRDPQRALDAIDWLRSQGLSIRGHNLVWPSWRHLPDWLEAQRDNPEQLRQTVRNHVTEIATATRGRLVDWDVVNEPYGNHDLMDILGDQEQAEWYRLVRLADPNAALYLNDNRIVSAGGWDIPRQRFYLRMIPWLDEMGAPLDGFGMQSHFGTQLTAPTRVWEVFNQFSAYGYAPFNMDLLITEFDIDTSDEQLQADYTRDFLTMAFSYPAIRGFYIWGFWAGRHWREQAAMYRQDWTAKPNAGVWRDLIYNQWWTDTGGSTGSDGILRIRGFLGDYEIEVGGNNGGTETFTLTTPEDRGPAYIVTGHPVSGSFSAEGVVNAASFAGGPVTPGEVITIFGAGFGPSELGRAGFNQHPGWVTDNYAGDTRVYFDGVPAPMVYSLRGQVSAIVPYTVAGATTIEIEYLGARTAPVTVPVTNAAPGIYCYSGGAGQAVAVNAGSPNSYNGPENPVDRGSPLTFFLTGEGMVSPTFDFTRGGHPGEYPVPLQPLQVYISGRECEVTFAGQIYPGVLQVNVVVPAAALTGDAVGLQVLIGGVASSEDVTIAVR